MMMNQSRCGMLLLVDQLRERDVEKWGLPMLNITSVERCAVLLEDDYHHSEIDHRLKISLLR